MIKTNLSPNGERLWQRHMAMAEIGAIDGGGNCRLAMSQEDAAARRLFQEWCLAAGLKIKIDAAGNMFGIRPGTEPGAALVLTGSHLDTQPHGGRFDGISGVLCGLEVIETLNDAGIDTQLPIAVVNWTNEEGVRFAPGLLGSSWFAGKIDTQTLHGTVSRDGARFSQEAEKHGYLGTAEPGDFNIDAFFELHIEQGPVLERQNCQIGVVESVQGLNWLDVSIAGVDAHAGTTPMDQRSDSLQAAARILTAINDLGLAHRPDARISVGYLKSATEGASTIAGQTDLVIDVRHPKQATLQELTSACRDLVVEAAQAQNCTADVRRRISIPPCEFDPDCVDLVQSAADHLGYTWKRMASGALHDASNLASCASTAMIFIPCKDGVSHNVRESVKPEDLQAGCNVLLRAILQRANPS